MIIAFPTQKDEGIESTVFGHFGSAAFFVTVDTETNAVDNIVNRDKDHLHGKCQPLKALDNQQVDAVVVGGIGRGALVGLNNNGIKVFRAVDGTVADNFALFKAGNLPAVGLDQTCAGHTHGGVCIGH
jgi:predicted Fe-Mo cluster-binding NifX family protein